MPVPQFPVAKAGLGAIPHVHTDPDGHLWHLTVHWADIDGQATPVGLDLRAFAEGDEIPTQLTGGILNAAALRSIRIGEVIEATRRNGTWSTPIKTPDGDPTERVQSTRGDATPTTKGSGRPAERGDDFIAQVAALFHHAKAQGGEPARKPWRYVADQLHERGIHNVTDGQLKNWSRRAKNLGLLSTREKE
jgi:hypothetical protein